MAVKESLRVYRDLIVVDAFMFVLVVSVIGGVSAVVHSLPLNLKLIVGAGCIVAAFVHLVRRTR